MHYLTGETSDTPALEIPGFVATPSPMSDTRTFRGEEQAWLLRLATESSVA